MELQACELRIGNIVCTSLCPEGWSVDANDIAFLDQHPGLYMPVPLTDEWLLRAGFVNNFLWEKDHFRLDNEHTFLL